MGYMTQTLKLLGFKTLAYLGRPSLWEISAGCPSTTGTQSPAKEAWAQGTHSHRSGLPGRAWHAGPREMCQRGSDSQELNERVQAVQAPGSPRTGSTSARTSRARGEKPAQKFRWPGMSPGSHRMGDGTLMPGVPWMKRGPEETPVPGSQGNQTGGLEHKPFGERAHTAHGQMMGRIPCDLQVGA